jgi:hypothetical protein
MPEGQPSNPRVPVQEVTTGPPYFDYNRLNKAFEVMTYGTKRIEYFDLTANKNVVVYQVGQVIRIDFQPLKP